MNSLKECPFCGSESMVLTGYGQSIKLVRCTDCGAEGPRFRIPVLFGTPVPKSIDDICNNSIKAWNNRHDAKLVQGDK